MDAEQDQIDFTEFQQLLRQVNDPNVIRNNFLGYVDDLNSAFCEALKQIDGTAKQSKAAVRQLYYKPELMALEARLAEMRHSCQVLSQIADRLPLENQSGLWSAVHSIAFNSLCAGDVFSKSKIKFGPETDRILQSGGGQKSGATRQRKSTEAKNLEWKTFKNVVSGDASSSENIRRIKSFLSSRNQNARSDNYYRQLLKEKHAETPKARKS